MDRVADGGVIWRRRVTPLLNKMGVVVMDPCNKPYHGAVEDDQNRAARREWKRNGEFEKIREAMKPIRTMDLRMVDVSDFVIACVDVEVHMCGSYEEITTANRQKKPILVWCMQGKDQTPDWLLGMIPHQHVFGTLEELLGYLCHVDSDSNVVTYRRWYFPIFDIMYNADVLGAMRKRT